MNRKSFLTTASTLLAGVTLSSLPVMANEKDITANNPVLPIVPPYLKKGDVIGITAPAGYITAEEIQPAVEVMESWGYKVKIGDTIGKKDFTFGGTDAERAADFQQMLNDKNVKAIMCARGGYGSVRIIDGIKWDKFKAKPKWIIGFSDITVIHSHLQRHFGIASMHSKMCNSFPDIWANAEPIQVATIESIHNALSGKKMNYSAVPNPRNRFGMGEGLLVGGNLKTLETLTGSASDIHTDGRLLFVEDTGEYMYSIDRMFWNLKRTGKLSRLKGLIVGGFKVRVDAVNEDFGSTIQDIVLEKVKAYKYPVCFDFPVGHQKDNFALKCGIKHRLAVNSISCTLTETAHA